MKRTLKLTAAVLLAGFLAAAQTTAERAASILDKALSARNPDTRVDAVKALSLAGSVEPFATRLDSMLKDKDVPVRIAAIDALAEQKTARAIESIRIALDDRTAEVRFAAAKALFKLNDEAGRRFLLEVLKGSTRTSSGLIAEQLREAQRTLQNPPKLMMLALKNGIGLVPVPYVDQGFAVIEFAVNRGESSRAATAILLAKSDDPAVAAALRAALSDKDARVRAAAARAIALEGDGQFADDLGRLVEDKNRKVQLQAAAGYLKLRNSGIAPAVTD